MYKIKWIYMSGRGTTMHFLSIIYFMNAFITVFNLRQAGKCISLGNAAARLQALNTELERGHAAGRADSVVK